MNSHKNARLGFAGRVCLVERVTRDGWTTDAAAAAFGVSVQSVRKWLRRYRTEGKPGLTDRSSRPHGSPRHLAARLEARIARLRARRQSGPQIADALGLPLSTVGDVLRRLGLGRLPPLQERPPIVRYERERPGELLHVDAKKLGRIGAVGHRIHGDWTRRARGVGWECLHVAVDDCSRVAYAELLPDESAASAVAFLDHAVAWLAGLGVVVERVMTDNAFCYTQRQYAQAVARLGLRHKRTRPYTPRTNGKAERFIQTALREWAYAKPYRSSAQRAGALGPFLTTYNTARPHTAHDRSPPLGGSGEVWGWYPSDSLRFVTVSTAGDTILWDAARARQTIEQLAGQYRIVGGQFVGQTGRWSIALARGSALSPHGSTRDAVRRQVSEGPWFAFWLGLMGVALALHWAMRRPALAYATPLPPDARDAALVGVGGWMAWFILGQGVTILLAASQLASSFAPFEDGTWAMGSMLPGLRPLVAVESVRPPFQMAGAALGIWLTIRRDARAPRYWFVYLWVMFAYAMVEVLGWDSLKWELARAFGQAAADSASREIAKDMQQTMRLLLWAPVWALYWVRAKRVRLTFGRGALGVSPLERNVVPPTVNDSPQATVVNSKVPMTSVRFPADEVAPASFSSTSPRIERDCPHCAKRMPAQAHFCKHCQRDVAPVATL